MYCRKQYEEDLVSVPDDKLIVAYPLGVTAEDMEYFHEKYNPLMNGTDDITELIIITSRIIKEISEKFDSVSPECDIGITAFDSNGVISWRIDEKCEFMVEAYSSGFLLGGLKEVKH